MKPKITTVPEAVQELNNVMNDINAKQVWTPKEFQERLKELQQAINNFLPHIPINTIRDYLSLNNEECTMCDCFQCDCDCHKIKVKP